MTDDELTAAAADVFKHFDRREITTERSLRLKEWAFAVFCWDGLLPIVVIAVPSIIMALLPRQDDIHILINVILPIVAFFVRAAMGGRQFARHEQYAWQAGLFVLAIFFLIFFDAMLILFREMPNQMMNGDWYCLGIMYLIYLAVIGLSLFPFRNPSKASISEIELGR